MFRAFLSLNSKLTWGQTVTPGLPPLFFVNTLLALFGQVSGITDSTHKLFCTVSLTHLVGVHVLLIISASKCRSSKKKGAFSLKPYTWSPSKVYPVFLIHVALLYKWVQIIVSIYLSHHIQVYTNVSFSGKAHIEFCCHLARGNIDPKETPVYEYVKFVGDFKFHKNGRRFPGQDSKISFGFWLSELLKKPNSRLIQCLLLLVTGWSCRYRAACSHRSRSRSASLPLYDWSLHSFWR